MEQQRQPVFSKQGYKDILINAQLHGYQFIGFGDMHKVNDDDKYCLMRHDVDTSLKCALEMAEIEHTLGVKATYFFMLRSPAYNLFGRYAYHVINRIKEMGHEIALHFDAAHPAVNSNDLVNAVEVELNILLGLSKQHIHAVSFHQPSPFILKGNTLVPGVINTYHKEQMKDWYYTSDSNRVWKEHNALSVFDCEQYKKIQILIHPIWWICEEPVIEDAWDHALTDNFYIMQQQFLDTEGAYGIPRSFTIKR